MSSLELSNEFEQCQKTCWEFNPMEMVVNTYNTVSWDCKSQPQASPFSHL